MKRSNKETFETGGLDWLSVFIYLIMIFFGWIAIYSAVYNPASPSIFDTDQNYGRQLIFICASILLAIVILIIDAKFFHAFAYFIYGVAILLCVGVIFTGAVTKGARAWFEIGSLKFQPAEIAKYSTALVLARFLGSYDVSFKKTRVKIISFLLFLIPMALVLLQNDTGSALVFLAFILVLFREGLSGILLAIGVFLGLLFILALLINKFYIMGSLFLLGVLAIIVVRKNRQVITALMLTMLISIAFVFFVDYFFNNILQEHQRARINVLFGKGGDDWNVRQSMIAIGSGGITGKGFLEGTQTKYNFVPEQSTDFIFCTIGEEYGFIGSTFVISLFMLLMARIVMIAERQKNKFSRIYAYSVACILFVHFTVNIGMTLGVMPVIGIPLPFFSYGGSSLLGFTLLLFTLLKLDANRVNEMQSLHE